MLVMRLIASSEATGQSLPNTTRPPPSAMLFHIPPRAARSGPMLRPQAPVMNPGVAVCAGAEARDVGQINRLDVLDAMAPASRGRRVGGRNMFEAVEHHPHGAVAEAMHH